MTFAAAILLAGLVADAAQNQPTCRSPVPFGTETTEVGTGGRWTDGDRGGRFRYFVFAAGGEHTTHTVEVEILEYVESESDEGRIATRVIGCVATGALTEQHIWWVDSIRIDITAENRSLLRIRLAYAENTENVRDHVLELRRDGRLRVVQEAFRRP